MLCLVKPWLPRIGLGAMACWSAGEQSYAAEALVLERGLAAFGGPLHVPRSVAGRPTPVTAPLTRALLDRGGEDAEDGVRLVVARQRWWANVVSSVASSARFTAPSRRPSSRPRGQTPLADL